tara:strand:+ start:1016 stop:2194 length:1179 start_codon:yes stop_codon:yes gene_type:complete
LNNIPNTNQADPIPESARLEVDELLSTGDLFRYTNDQSAVSNLEQNFAVKIGSSYALAVSSCSAALFLALKALNLGEKARVLIPAFTFGAVPSAVVHANCIPVLCECGMDYRIDIDDFLSKLESVDVALISHMRGHTSDMDKILFHCDRLEIPVIEDAAHSLGTTWKGKHIGTLGQLGCFSFQSYKLLNSGEGGMLVTNDPDAFAKAVVMSGAYEHNWKKHQGEQEYFEKWQNQLPLYNMRLNNLSASIVNAQLPYLDDRVENGRRNHDITAALLSSSEWIHVPEKFEQEARAPDSIQFNLVGLTPPEVSQFSDVINTMGVKLQVFGLSKNNARAFWNWDFLPEKYNLPKTRKMLRNACDVRLPARLNLDDCQNIAKLILEALRQIKNDVAA